MNFRTKLQAAWAALAFLSIGVALYAAIAYGFLPLGANVQPEMRAVYEQHPAGIYLHVFGSIFALALGPFQFSSRLRARQLNLHRWMGRLYLGVGVLVGGLAGLYMSRYAHGGPVAQAGFGALALAWIYTGARAFDAIRGGETLEHRKWMIRNFSLAFAAVTLRLYLPIPVVAGVAFASAYAVIAWACWLPNLAFAEWWIRRHPIRAAG